MCRGIQFNSVWREFKVMILKKKTQKQCGRITVQANKLGTFPNAQCTKYHNVICTTQKEQIHRQALSDRWKLLFTSK